MYRKMPKPIPIYQFRLLPLSPRRRGRFLRVVAAAEYGVFIYPGSITICLN